MLPAAARGATSGSVIGGRGALPISIAGGFILPSRCLVVPAALFSSLGRRIAKGAPARLPGR